MGQFTHYLSVREIAPSKFRVGIHPDSPFNVLKTAIRDSTDIRYSPILQAYTVSGPVSPPATPRAIAFFFSDKPHRALGELKLILSASEMKQVFFSQGLASILMLNCSKTKADKLRTELGKLPLEYWELRKGLLVPGQISIINAARQADIEVPTDLTLGGDPTLNVYVEQIAASVATLWPSYGIYFPQERGTLSRIVAMTQGLVDRYEIVSGLPPSLGRLRKQNAIISALMELSAALSYSVTQGTTGASPILSNRSPFPHHSLLGVGGSIRCLTNFARYIEAAFVDRSPAEVINQQYAQKEMAMPYHIGQYESGATYKFDSSSAEMEEFDSGGSFRMEDDLPLLAHFSLRHGFKETKFAVTAASEALTAECMPAWTLMTLSHEIMHSQVRNIFQALFGAEWEEDYADERWNDYCREFAFWSASEGKTLIPRKQAIRNAVLHFCCANERHSEAVKSRRSIEEKQMTVEDLHNSFKKYRRMATELFVHFHDFYFSYACHRELYVMSLWATWTTVAAVVARPKEYLIRTLATIACGSGLEARAAFNGAADVLESGLTRLESVGVSSALFAELRSLLKDEDRERICQTFKPAYYLIDQARDNFASPKLARKIDSIQEDPFSAGSGSISEYSANPFVFGEKNPDTKVNPIRFCLTAFIREILQEPPRIDDQQWVTAWNALVISSLEVR
jgi:hypothetical protein